MMPQMDAARVDLAEPSRSMRARGAARVARADELLLQHLREAPRLDDAGWPAPSRALALLTLLLDERHAMAGFVIGVAALVGVLGVSSLVGVPLPTR